MSDPKLKKRSFSPFLDRVELSKHDNFDQFYDVIEYREIYRKVGVDSEGLEYGSIEIKPIVKKKSISDLLAEEVKSVGIDSYMRALAIQGVSADDFFTNVDLDKVQDFSDAPDNKFDGALYGKKAVAIFNNLDPVLKDNHTTIEGFLNSLTKDKIDAYIKGKVEAAFPSREVKKEGE